MTLLGDKGSKALLSIIPFHALFDAKLEVAFHECGDLRNRLVKGGAVLGRELGQHPVTEVELGRALAYPETDARELVADMLDDVPEPVLTAVTAVRTATDTAYVQINVITKNQQMVGLDLVPGHECLNRFAGKVHERLRLCEQALLARDVHLHGERLVLALPVLVRVGKLFDCHEARVVVRVGVLSTRISETYDDVHAKNLDKERAISFGV